MSDSENEGEMKRLTNVDELKEILASFDAADRKTSARGVKESLRAARAVIEQILARPWEEPDEDDDVTVDDEDAIPQHAIENREFCERRHPRTRQPKFPSSPPVPGGPPYRGRN